MLPSLASKSICSPGWPLTSDPLSIHKVLGSQACTTMLSVIPCWGSNSWILECCTSTLPAGCRPQLCTAHFRGGSFMRWGQIYPKNTTTDSVLSPSMALWLQSVGALSLTSVYVVRVSLRSGIIHCGPGSCPGPAADYIQWVIPCPCPENMWFCNSTVAFTQVQKKISHLVLGNFFFFFIFSISPRDL